MMNAVFSGYLKFPLEQSKSFVPKGAITHCSQLTGRQPNNWNVIEPFTINWTTIDETAARPQSVTKVKMASHAP